MEDLIPVLKKDEELKDVVGAVSYLRDLYDRLKHVKGYRSSNSRAETTLGMTKELVNCHIPENN